MPTPKFNGVTKLDQGGNWYVAVASITTAVPESFELEIAEGGSVLRRLGDS